MLRRLLRLFLHHGHCIRLGLTTIDLQGLSVQELRLRALVT